MSLLEKIPLGSPSTMSFFDILYHLFDTIRIDIQRYLSLFCICLIVFDEHGNNFISFIMIFLQSLCYLDIYIYLHDKASFKEYSDKISYTNNILVNEQIWAMFINNYTIIRLFDKLCFFMMVIGLFTIYVCQCQYLYSNDDIEPNIVIVNITQLCALLTATSGYIRIYRNSKKQRFSRAQEWVYYKFDTFLYTSHLLIRNKLEKTLSISNKEIWNLCKGSFS